MKIMELLESAYNELHDPKLQRVKKMMAEFRLKYGESDDIGMKLPSWLAADPAPVGQLSVSKSLYKGLAINSEKQKAEDYYKE